MADIDNGAGYALAPPCDQDEGESAIWFVEWAVLEPAEGGGQQLVSSGESETMTWDEAVAYADQLYVENEPEAVEAVIMRLASPFDAD